MQVDDNDAKGKSNAAARGKPCAERPWCWQEKAILRMIGDIFDATGDVSLARTVYLALCEIASDEQSDTFTKSVAEIARRAALSYRKTWEILNRLESLKIVAVQRNTVTGTKEHAPSTYTLCTQNITLCTDRKQASVQKGLKNLLKNHEAGCARKEKNSGSNTCGNSLAEKHGFNKQTGDTFITKTGERFNPKTGEYDW